MHLSPFYTRMHGEWLRYANSTSQYSLAFSLYKDDWGFQVNPLCRHDITRSDRQIGNPSSSSERDAASKRYGNAPSVTALWITCVICPKDGWDVTDGWCNRPGSIKAHAVEPASVSGMKQPLAGMPEVWPRDAASRSLEELGLHT